MTGNQQLSRTPSDGELADQLRLTLEEVWEGRRADRAFRSLSLDAPLSTEADTGTLADVIGAEDHEVDIAADLDAVWGRSTAGEVSQVEKEHPAGDDPPGDLAERVAATRLALTETLERLTQSRDRLNETFQSMSDSPSGRAIFHKAEYSRLPARLHTMPVIEQAKGILMAESRCSPDEAFAMLRAASQRSNVRVRDLAEQIVGRVSGVQSQPAAEVQSQPAADVQSPPAADESSAV